MSNVTTTIRLPAELHEALRRRAFDQRSSVAALIRDAVRRMLESPAASGDLPELERDPLWAAVGSVGGDSSDEAIEHDHYLYDTPKRSGAR